MTKQQLLAYTVIAGLTAAILIIALFAVQLFVPQLVNFYYLATHYQEAAIGLLLVAAVLIVFKLLSSDL